MITVDKYELMGEYALKNWIIYGLTIGSPIFFVPNAWNL